MDGSLPHRSRSQGRPSGVASAGLPLDGCEREGNRSVYTGKVNANGSRLLESASGFFLLFHFAAQFMAENIL